LAAGAGNFPAIRELRLTSCGIAEPGGQALLNAGWPESLRLILLYRNQIDREAASRSRFGKVARM
jgi:hypothetical protein